ncbi:MAG: nitroreductase [Desulfuromonadales bacterium]|nr:nitroreductase [Desulfuromonadales bacterium]
MDSIAALMKRRVSCRKFSDQTPTRETIDTLIQTAVWAPSGSNNQPWRFVVITDREKLKSISDAAKRSWLESLDTAPFIRQYEKWMNDPAYNIFYNAPALIIIYGDSAAHWQVYDCSMVAQNINLLAEEGGLGCCWIGFAHNVLNEAGVKLELGVPEQYELVAPLIIGYPAVIKERTENPIKRKPFEITYR